MSRHALLVEASRLYYELGATQEEIAHALGVTRPQVSRLLKEAREEGIVEIRIHDGERRNHELEQELRRRFGLQAVRLSPRIATSPEASSRALGRAGAVMLLEHLQDGQTVGVGSGASLAAVAGQLTSEPRRPMVSFVALNGGGYSAGGGQPVRRMGEALGARFLDLYAPGIMPDRRARDALLASFELAAVRQAWEFLDLVIVGIGAFVPREAWAKMGVLADLQASGAVGELLLQHFDLEGELVGQKLRDMAVAYEARDLPRVPIRIGVAGGPEKIRPVLGALRTGLLSALVTDDETALAALKLDARLQEGRESGES